MKKILIILLLLPFFAFSQSEKRYKSIIIDSVKALNSGSIDFKDTVFFQRHVEIDSSFQVNDGLTLLKGLDASTNKFALKVQDNVGTEIFNVRNDNKISFRGGSLADDLGSAVVFSMEIVNARAIIIPNQFRISHDIGGNMAFGVAGNGIDGLMGNVNTSGGGLDIRTNNFPRINISFDGKVGFGFDPLTLLQFTNVANAKYGLQGISVILGDLFIKPNNVITADNQVRNSTEINLRGLYDSDPGGGFTESSFDATFQHIIETITPTSRLAFSIDGNEFLSIKSSGNIGIGTETPAISAILDITTTTGAVLFPRMTTTQRDALTAVGGMVIYNTTLNKLQVRAVAAWVSLH